MEQKQYSASFIRLRKFLTVLPVLVIPFLLIIFFALGGGRQDFLDIGKKNQSGRLNPRLPDAHFKKGREKDKLGLYEQNNRDSAKLKEQIRKDPYYLGKDARTPIQDILEHAASQWNQPGLKIIPLKDASDSNEKKIMDRLSILKNLLAKKSGNGPSALPVTEIPKKGVNELQPTQNMYPGMTQKNNPDPELEKLNQMLDKLMLIQHPEKFRDSLLASGIKNKKESYPVSTRPEVLEGSWSSSQNAFFGLDDEYTEPASNSTAMEAIVDQTQTLVTGATVKLRLLEDIYIQGNRIPKDELIYGISSLENERLKISIHSIRSQENILPVSLDVYDLDGIEGIYIPGSISRDAGKQSADQAISSMAIASLDPSVGAQAANAGIQAAKTLMSKKIKLVRATLKAGYRVLLVDNHRSS